MSLKFIFSKKATKIYEIFIVDNLTLCSKRQSDGEDFFNFRGLENKNFMYKLQEKLAKLHSCHNT